MRTENDLVAALAQREDLAPEPDPVLAGARTAATGYRRRRMIAAVGVVAAIAVAAAVTVPVWLTGSGAEPAEPPIVPSGQAERPPFAFTIERSTVAGFEIRPWGVTPDYQLAQIVPAGEEEPVAELIVYRPDPEFEVGNAEALLRWEYTPGGFAEIQGEAGLLDEATLQQLADGVQFTEPYGVRLPYRLDYLPAGMTPTAAGQHTGPGAVGSVIGLENLSADPAAPPVIDIVVGEGFPPDPPDADLEPTTVAGYPAECGDLVDGRRCQIDIEAFTVLVDYANLDDSELAEVIAGMHPATLDDPASWYEIDEALPTQ